MCLLNKVFGVYKCRGSPLGESGSSGGLSRRVASGITTLGTHQDTSEVVDPRHLTNV